MKKSETSIKKYGRKCCEPQNIEFNIKEKSYICNKMCSAIKSKRNGRDKTKHKRKLKILLEFCDCVVLGILLIVGSTLGSLVVDTNDQKGLKYSEYCPTIGACTAGSHVLCSHYNPNTRFGVSCMDPEDIKMTLPIATYILQVMNAMRARVAQGIEVGAEKLPRAYGLLRLKWDVELATFAQLWADNCLRYQSPCQATKRFNDPYALVVDMKYKYPEWTKLGESGGKPGMNNDKIYELVTNALKFVFSTKTKVNAAEVYTTGVQGILYQNVVNSDVTHIGCGISGFTKFETWQLEHLAKNFELVCYLSAQLSPDKPLYRTSPPRPTDTQKCGCEPGYKEDEDCLCSEDGLGMCGEDNEKCKPPVVLLPIVTYEDMPNNINKSDNNDDLSSISKRFNGLSTLLPSTKPKPRESRNSFVPTEFDTSRKAFMKINIAPVKDLTGARGTLNKYLEKIRNEQTDDYAFSETPNIPDFTISDYIKTKLENHNSTSMTVDLVSLLNKVEDEIRGANLNTETMRIIEDKIKKIYAAILGKNYDSLKENIIGNTRTNHFDQYNLISGDNDLKTIAQDILELNRFGPVKSSNVKYENVGNVAHRIQNIVEDPVKLLAIESQTKKPFLDIFDDADVLSDDRKKYYEDILLNLKRKKDQRLKTFVSGQYILERPVHRLRPSHHIMQKELTPYINDSYNSADSDFLY